MPGLGTFSLVVGLIALGFLAYSLLMREQLGIGFFHPRILVEAALAVAGIGIWLWQWLG